MATSFAGRPVLPPTAADDNDPFVTPSAPAHHRYSHFDSQLFALGPASSPGQAKRALEAHLAETERRMEEAGKLGTALVQQRKELADRLQEVEKLQAEGELTPELRSKLNEIEKEYNDVARETARAFLPKQRVPSNETAGGSPYVPEGRGGRRSVSPSKFESQATGSPTKLTVPNRKLRNQPNRVHDIEFAAEISTSLLAQVRNLQSLLAEKDEELRDVKSEKSRLEIEAESFQQRVKTLDESEHRYKDENWNLETQIHELMASQKDGADREKKMTHAFSLLQAEKNQAQKELDEVRLTLSKLGEEHDAAVKHHDIELGTAKRNAALAENERSTLQKKIDDLTGQNQELARAVSSQRGRAMEKDDRMGLSDEDFDSAAHDITPEHSPPPSPIKGTPRHPVLESETLKTSLLHAQRTIQTQRSQLHREKTEKLELKRLLQDSRDEIEKLRGDPAGGANRRSRKVESREFKKPTKALLGGLRSSRSEVFTEDAEWEEHGGDSGSGSARVSPTRSSPPQATPSTVVAPGAYPMTTDAETSDAAFETANDRGTETEDFLTGAEEFSGEDDVDTETESPSRNRSKRAQNLTVAGNRSSFHSTASTSADEDFGFNDVRTPVAPQQQKMRLKVSRGFLNRQPRQSRQASEEPQLQSSPMSLANSSAAGTPQAGQSLFAELAELDGSDEESMDATPSRSTRSFTPGSGIKSHATTPSGALPLLKLAAGAGAMGSIRSVTSDPVKRAQAQELPKMVDCGTMTEFDSPPQSPASVIHYADRPMSMGSVLLGSAHTRSRPQSSWSDATGPQDLDIGEKLAQFPLPPSSPPLEATTESTPELVLSAIEVQSVDPLEEPELVVLRPEMSFTVLNSQTVEPEAEPEIVVKAPVLTFSSFAAEGVEPVSEAEIVPLAPQLALSTLLSETIQPLAETKAEPEVVYLPSPAPPIPRLCFSEYASEAVEPRAEPELLLPAPVLALSSLYTHEVEPREEAAVKPALPVLGLSSLFTHNIVPQEQSAPPPAVLAYSTLLSENVEPHVDPRVNPRFSLSGLTSWNVEPRVDSKPLPPSLTFSSVASEEFEPVTAMLPGALAPHFSFSALDSIETRPITPRSPKRDGFILPRGMESPFSEANLPRTPKNAIFGAALGRGKGKKATDPIIAEDETRQSPSGSPETPESQRPFKEISPNTDIRPRKQLQPMADHSAQTSLTADAIDELFKVKAKGHEKSLSQSSVGTPGTVRIRRFSQEGRAASPQPEIRFDTARRPGSASSNRGTTQPFPPLPANHKEVIEAARTGSAHGRQGSATGTATVMGPPLWPASAMRTMNQRPETPSTRPQSSNSLRGTPTPKASAVRGTALIHSPTKMSARSRRSSVSSFASEIDTRFNGATGANAVDPTTGFGPNTDPRMIRAITQTMIGEYLWKYTRKPGRGEMSGNRHRRYFWVHPYTRTLYWSDRDPSTGGAEAKAKSVPIEAVRVVTDDNPMPPGLHRKSLVVIAPGRVVKFTCPTAQRHEEWYNALSYLLMRTNEGKEDVEEMAGGITAADVDEFNPQVPGRRSNASARPRAPPSLSSYASRTTNQSPAVDMSMNVPTLTPTGRRDGATSSASVQRPSIGTLGRLSGYWKGSQLSGTFSSLRSRTVSGISGSNGQGHAGIYEASEVHDSAEDVREMIERQDRESGRMENVRACCDGKHDVGTLHRRGRGGHVHSHSTGGVPTMSTPMSTMKSRA